MRRSLLVCTAVVLTACGTQRSTANTPVVVSGQPVATPPPATAAAASVPSAADLVDHLGDTYLTAVPVPPDAPNEGVDFQNRWMFEHFGRFRRQKFAMGHAPGSPGHERHFDIITIELPDHSFHTVYFDMTDFWEEMVRKSKEQ